MDLRSISRLLLICALQPAAAVFVAAEQSVARNGSPPLEMAAVGTAQPAQLPSPLDRLYSQRLGEPIWYSDGQPNGRIALLTQAIAAVAAEGLEPARYVLPERIPDSALASQALRLHDRQLTGLYLRLARDLHAGEFSPREIDANWYLPVEPFDPAAALQILLQRTDPQALVQALTPQSPGYRRLRDALRAYRLLAAQGGWQQLPAFATLRPGEQRPEVPLLRSRLQVEGDHPATEPLQAELFDATLEAAVRHFQARNGLVEDGVVGAKTLAALNVPVEERVNQIRANLERWRWLPRNLGNDYLLVNTAGYELSLVIDGQPVLRQRTINGTQERQTPSFASRITHLVVNPKWTVPRLIAVKDLLPKQQRDVEYLPHLGIQVLQHQDGEWVQLDPLSIDWQQYNKNNFPFTLRQAPGEKNSLGKIKFLMNNPYAIFLHDTPAKGLFAKPIRAFSSGCIRVQGVDQLARSLLLNGGQSPDEALDEPLQSQQTRTQKLARPMPVYLVYFTSWVDDSGQVNFRPDIYRRNGGLLLALGTDSAKITAANHLGGDNSL